MRHQVETKEGDDHLRPIAAAAGEVVAVSIRIPYMMGLWPIGSLRSNRSP